MNKQHFYDIIKSYIDVGIEFVDDDLNSIEKEKRYIHPIIKVGDRYIIQAQGDEDSNYLYGLKLNKIGNEDLHVHLSEASLPIDLKKFIDLIKNGDKDIDLDFDFLKVHKKLTERLDNLKYGLDEIYIYNYLHRAERRKLNKTDMDELMELYKTVEELEAKNKFI